MEIEVTQGELDGLIRHLEFALSRYEAEGCAFLAARDCPGAERRGRARLDEADSARALLDKLLHI